VVSALTEHILPLVPGLTGRLERGIEVLDVGCGSGKALNLLARRQREDRGRTWLLAHDGSGAV
jgi:SAM-dependent methyltransferase